MHFTHKLILLTFHKRDPMSLEFISFIVLFYLYLELPRGGEHDYRCPLSSLEMIDTSSVTPAVSWLFFFAHDDFFQIKLEVYEVSEGWFFSQFFFFMYYCCICKLSLIFAVVLSPSCKFSIDDNLIIHSASTLLKFRQMSESIWQYISHYGNDLKLDSHVHFYKRAFIKIN